MNLAAWVRPAHLVYLIGDKMKKLLLLSILLALSLSGCFDSLDDIKVTIDPGARQICDSRTVGCDPILIRQIDTTGAQIGTVTTTDVKYTHMLGVLFYRVLNSEGSYANFDAQKLGGIDYLYWFGKSISVTYDPTTLVYRTGTELWCGIPKDANGVPLYEQNIDYSNPDGTVLVNVRCIRAVKP